MLWYNNAVNLVSTVQLLYGVEWARPKDNNNDEDAFNLNRVYKREP